MRPTVRDVTTSVLIHEEAARDPGVAIEQLFRGMRKGRAPSTTFSTTAVCARTSVERSRAWREADSSTFGKLTSHL